MYIQCYLIIGFINLPLSSNFLNIYLRMYCMYVCTYVCKIFLIHDQCTYSPLNRILNFLFLNTDDFIYASRSKCIYVCLYVCMYVYMNRFQCEPLLNGVRMEPRLQILHDCHLSSQDERRQRIQDIQI
jgi:hypothetical protein